MDYRKMDGGGGQNSASLARQSSIYSLTFDEFQSTLGGLGKDFGSMNMDEFLKNIWTAEESQAMAAVVSGEAAAAGGCAFGLQRQGSLTLPRTLSQKTVDDVWRDLVSAGQGPSAAPEAVAGGRGGGGVADVSRGPRQPTLGEMTLEEFLVRAGVVREDATPAAAALVPPPMPSANSGASKANVLFGGSAAGLGFAFSQSSQVNGLTSPTSSISAANLAMSAAGTRPYATVAMPLASGVDAGNAQGMKGGGFMDIGDLGLNSALVPGMISLGAGCVPVPMDSPASHLPSDGLGKNSVDTSSVSPVPYVFNGGARGRRSTGAAEKVVERRQRRMIKNRESAARSRARKQAYTMELEAEVAKLKEQNDELMKKQAEMMEMQKKQVLEVVNQRHGPKKQCLRRTQTGPDLGKSECTCS